MTIKSLLTRCTEKKARNWVLTILILAISLVFIIPGADEYTKLETQRSELRAQVAKTRHEVAGLDEVQRTAAERRKKLADLEARTVSVEQAHLFRQEVVEFVRESECQVREIHLAEPSSRVFREGDSPLEQRSSGKRNRDESPYILNTQPLSLSITGTLPSVKNLLSRLQATEKMIYSKSLSLVPSRENREEVALNLELLLFDLTKVETPQG